MDDALTSSELKSLIQSVFSLKKTDKKLAILVDIPDEAVTDNHDWYSRRDMAQNWKNNLDKIKPELNIDEINLVLYPNVHSNNADLPETAYFYSNSMANLNVENLKKYGSAISFVEVLSSYQIIIALTELSATAPLKLSAKKYNFRAVTMPGFTSSMVASLRLDYKKINDLIMKIKHILDPATGLKISFKLDDGSKHQTYFDLRFRTATASGGRFPNDGTAGNLPGGECYIVPYEGEKGESSLSKGILPVQFEDEIVIYEIENNCAQKVISTGNFSSIEAQKIKDEPAYSNIAEIGFGILRYFGIKPIGQILLDEKLGLHIAFGRSDHFGGAVGIKDFKKPENVIHIDRIFMPETQNKIDIEYVKSVDESNNETLIIENNEYKIF